MKRFITIKLCIIFAFLFESCSVGWYEEQNLGNGYYLYVDPYEILFSENDNCYEYVIEPYVESYAFDSRFIVAKSVDKNPKSVETRDSLKFKYWIVDKEDSTSMDRKMVRKLVDKTTSVYYIKGSVKGPFDTLTYKRMIDSLGIRLDMIPVKYGRKSCEN